MNRIFFAAVFTLAGILTAGCDGGGLTPNQKVAANKQWNDARASVLASLATDQYKNGNLDKCQETIDQAIRLEPANASLYVLAAKLAIEQGKLEVADAHLFEARKLDPKNGEVDYLMGVVLQRWQQTQKAYDCYAAAAAKSPTELSYLLAQAEMLVSLNRPAEALALLQEKSGSFEHSGVLRDEMGQILVQLKHYTQAVAALREASILSTDDSTVREHLAFALLDNKQYIEAGEVFSRLLNENGYHNRADLLAALGECQSETHQLTEARASFESATTVNPNCGGFWLGLGKVAIEAGDLSTAELAVRKAISIDPNVADAQCLLGYVRLKQNQLPQSLAAFHMAADLDPADSVSICLQGYVLARMGKSAEARPFYAKALKLNPNDDLAGHLMAGLDSHD